jgi:hypothetical protein
MTVYRPVRLCDFVSQRSLIRCLLYQLWNFGRRPWPLTEPALVAGPSDSIAPKLLTPCLVPKQKC